MIFFEFARRNIRLFWLRSILAVIGIIIGVVAIASMGILGNSLVLSVSDSLSTVGDTIVITPHTSGGMFQTGGAASNNKISDRDIEQIRRAAAPNPVIPLYIGSDRITYGADKGVATLYGMAEDDIPLLLEVKEGTYLRGPGSCLAGTKLAENYHITVGSKITVGDGTQLRIVGILKERGAGFDINPDYGLVVSEKWFASAYSRNDYDQAIVKVLDLSKIDMVKEDIDRRMNRKEKVIDVIDTKKILESIISAFNQISVFVMVIGGISLIVAGISILNIMLMSVTERIKEIGIMRSIGTLRRDVMKMFLYEALILGLIGSSIGGLLSVLGGYLVSLLMLQTTKYLFEPSVISAVFVAMGFGIATSVISGFYPAWKAANLSPIEALRHE